MDARLDIYLYTCLFSTSIVICHFPNLCSVQLLDVPPVILQNYNTNVQTLLASGITHVDTRQHMFFVWLDKLWVSRVQCCQWRFSWPSVIHSTLSDSYVCELSIRLEVYLHCEETYVAICTCAMLSWNEYAVRRTGSEPVVASGKESETLVASPNVWNELQPSRHGLVNYTVIIIQVDSSFT